MTKQKEPPPHIRLHKAGILDIPSELFEHYETAVNQEILSCDVIAGGRSKQKDGTLQVLAELPHSAERR